MLVAILVAVVVVIQGPIRAASATDTSASRSCDVNLATARIRALFDALGGGDVGQVARLFPTPGSWKFRHSDSNTVKSRDGSLAIRANPDHLDELRAAVRRHDAKGIISLFPFAGGWYFDMGQRFAHVIESEFPRGELPHAKRPAQLRSLVQEFEGMQIQLVGSIGGAREVASESVNPSGVVNADVYRPGRVEWRASSDALRDQDIAFVEGVSKMALYCRGGLFQRVLLTPSRVVRASAGR